MGEDEHKLSSTRMGWALPLGINLSWLEVLVDLWKWLRKILRGLADEGMYEVLEYESTLELKDAKGERALFRKREKVRYLQNHIIAYQDEAWGDGEILINYRCTPGVAVDRYRPDKTTYIVISLREVKNRGDIDEFNIEWEMRNSFRRNAELWSAEINQRMKQLKLQVIFPKSRPPLRLSLVEDNSRRTFTLGEETQVRLPDGRWLVSWETQQPRLHETYSLRWEW